MLQNNYFGHNQVLHFVAFFPLFFLFSFAYLVRERAEVMFESLTYSCPPSTMIGFEVVQDWHCVNCSNIDGGIDAATSVFNK